MNVEKGLSDAPPPEPGTARSTGRARHQVVVGADFSCSRAVHHDDEVGHPHVAEGDVLEPREQESGSVSGFGRPSRTSGVRVRVAYGRQAQRCASCRGGD
jgi:hypothetical protein